MALSPELLEILACPQCKGPVEPTPDQAWLVCRACGLRYPVQDDIPVMLPEEASPLED
ncbi:MAG: Trm112 family protein [Desulfarculaceae bacterium]|nr:Trm112 family protein [Desulfarculaceae bacterium]